MICIDAWRPVMSEAAHQPPPKKSPPAAVRHIERIYLKQIEIEMQEDAASIFKEAPRQSSSPALSASMCVFIKPGACYNLLL